MFRETDTEKGSRVIGDSSGFAVDSSYSSSSGMVGNCRMGVREGQGQHCCVSTGDARLGAMVVPFPLSPSHSPAREFPRCAACREHQLPCRNSSSQFSHCGSTAGDFCWTSACRVRHKPCRKPLSGSSWLERITQSLFLPCLCTC